ncbi:MAG: polyprenyl synthetase family protein [Coxiellaceae bacterium]|nr:polyprenyl synthetase family protein [Coxiellaceae bacterium]
MRDLLKTYCARVDKTLNNAIFSAKNSPAILRDAMHYSTSNGGKRLRPLLVYATGHCFNLSPEKLDPIAAAVECIHAYSLIHDDLPAMDDDNLRRGKPTCHIVFSEAIAILAGDALQTLAFQLVAQSAFSADSKLKMIEVLSHHVGASGMIGGQALDMLAENKATSIDEIELIHQLKTGALIRASVALGAIASQANAETCLKLDNFAIQLGLAFQLQDDLQDIIGDPKALGKNTGQDAKHHKSTYALTEGVEATKARIHNLKQSMNTILQSIEKPELLEALCDKLICI